MLFARSIVQEQRNSKLEILDNLKPTLGFKQPLEMAK